MSRRNIPWCDISFELMKNFLAFLRRETVFAVATLLAIVSAIAVPPDAGYCAYVDFRVLGILLSLMMVMEGYKRIGLFQHMGRALLRRASTVRRLCITLIMLTFFGSMLLTNDVALITMVPFAMLVLSRSGNGRHLIRVIVLQTLAANLGSMLTPIGNPQNLYMYSLSGLTVAGFGAIMLPYCLVSFVMLMLSAFAFPNHRVEIVQEPEPKPDMRLVVVYTLLFALCLATVARIVPFVATLIMVIAVVWIVDKRILVSVDYFLILTFVSFFVLTGNIQRISGIRDFLCGIVSGNEVITGIVASQVISNVPAALLLSGFSGNVPALTVGVNLGGLGTLIASMASLISYKFFAHSYNDAKGRYLGIFTMTNVIFLTALMICHWLMN